MDKCYCNSEKIFSNCCQPFLEKTQFPEKPEQLMRSRYTAYVLQKADYLIETTHVSQRKNYSKAEILLWSKNNTWQKLEVLKAHDTIVSFKAYYLDEFLQAQIHHEVAIFKQEDNLWFYVDGTFY